jgi:hypothetical protein
MLAVTSGINWQLDQETDQLDGVASLARSAKDPTANQTAEDCDQIGFSRQGPSLMREAIVDDRLYLLEIETVDICDLLGGKSRLIVVENEVSLHTGVLENRHATLFALHPLNLITA